MTITNRLSKAAGCRYLLTIVPGGPRQVQITFPLWSSKWKVLYTVFTSAWWKRSCGTQSWRAEGRETTWLGWGSDRKAGICGRQGANTDVIASSLESRDSPPRLWSTGWQHCHSSFPRQPLTEGHQRVRMMKILPHGSNCDNVVYRVPVRNVTMLSSFLINTGDEIEPGFWFFCFDCWVAGSQLSLLEKQICPPLQWMISSPLQPFSSLCFWFST